jgi:hypothetical protein
MNDAHAAFPSANGAPHPSLGQRPRKTVPHSSPALKGRANGLRFVAVRFVRGADWIALSGLCAFRDAIPRALPWAGMGRRVAAPEMRASGTPQDQPPLSANGAPHTSLGQRPRKTVPQSFRALKGRQNAPLAHEIWVLDRGGWVAPSGRGSFVDAIPRALPWAGVGRRVAAGGTTR